MSNLGLKYHDRQASTRLIVYYLRRISEEKLIKILALVGYKIVKKDKE